MKIAVVGDVHANLEALTAVLADIDTQKPDAVYCVGDIAGYGADPAACISLIRERSIPTVIGNWDQTVAGTVDNIDGYNTRAQCSAYWTRGALSPEEKRFLAGLPDTVIENGVQVVHARPGEGNPMKYIMSVEEAHEAAAAAQAPVVFHGHTHIAGVFFDEEPLSYSKDDEFTVPAGVTAVINVGAPGQPRDGDTRAIWCLYDTETRKGQFRRCEYDKETASRKIIDSGQPPLLGERLLLGK